LLIRIESITANIIFIKGFIDMELSLKQSPSMDTNQDPMQAQLALQQRQLEQQQALEKADLSKVQGQIENKVGNKLDQHSPEDQKILKKALAKEAVRVGGEDARIGGIGVYPETGKLVALVGEFHHAYLDPKATLEAAKLATPEASKTLETERERSPALDKTPERDTSQVLAKIDAKVEHKLDAYSPEEQQVLKQALAAEMVKIGGENAPISRMGVTDDGKIAVSNERHTAVIDARATLETAEKEQASLVREQAAQELAQQNPEQAALEKHVDERYDHHMATIQDEMKSLNAIRADYDNFAALPEAERDALNNRMNELSSQRSALHDVTDLPIQEQAAYYAQRDQGESTPPIAETTADIHPEHVPISETQPLPLETVLPQEQSNTPPVPEGTISEDNLQRYADQGIEPVLESPPLDVPPLAPEDMTVSDAEMARLNAELNTISTEGAAVNAANTEAQAASETKEFTEINQVIDQMQDSSDKSLWENVKDTANQTLETASKVGGYFKQEGSNFVDTVAQIPETAANVGGYMLHEAGNFYDTAAEKGLGMYDIPALVEAKAVICDFLEELGNRPGVTDAEIHALGAIYGLMGVYPTNPVDFTAWKGADKLLAAAKSVRAANTVSNTIKATEAVTKISTNVKVAAATFSAGANVAGQMYSNPNKEINYTSLGIATTVGYFVPGQGLAGTLAMSNTGVAIDGGLQGKSVGDIGKAIVLNSAFTSMGYGVGEYISNLSKPYSRNIQQLDLMQIKHTMGKNHPYTMNHPTNFKYDYSISEIMGNTTGTGVTEYASQKANQFNNK
jgi:hypothetical protein